MAVLALALATLLTGCRREEITAYRVPKEKPRPAAASASTSPPARPQLRWELPAGWREEPSTSFRAANFSVTGEAGQQADVSVIPLPGLGGSDLDFVNLWRQQLGLPPAVEADLAGRTEPVTIAGATGKLFDIAAEGPAKVADRPDRILVAVLVRGGTSWFFKLQGDEPLVGQQRNAFVDFLKSVSFLEAPAAPSAPVIASTAAGDKPEWEIPSGWQEVPPTQMLRAKFVVGAGADARAEINISSFPGDVGGLLANVNRWRGQVGLPPLGEAELNATVESLDVLGGQAMLVDMTGKDSQSGQPARLIGAIVPRRGQTWFYVLRGPEELAGRERPAFLKFIQSARYPNA
jgi:hypothetical protein